MRKPNEKYEYKANATLFNTYLKIIKSEVPRACSFLSLMKKTDGELRIRAVINGEIYQFSVPQDLQMTEADLERVKNLIIEKCNV
jgi:hypothetical protein